jgi:predicted nucleotidyltransferase
VNSLLLTMLTQLQAALGQRLTGFYLYGSLSLGDFDPPSSDIDFIIATRESFWSA